MGDGDRHEKRLRRARAPQRERAQRERAEAAQERPEGDGAYGQLRPAELVGRVVDREPQDEGAGRRAEPLADQAEGDAECDDEEADRERGQHHQHRRRRHGPRALGRLAAEMRAQQPLGGEAEGDEGEGKTDQVFAIGGIARDPHEEHDRGRVQQRRDHLGGEIDRGEEILHAIRPRPRRKPAMARMAIDLASGPASRRGSSVRHPSREHLRR
ncbi:MAG: hypothetical protein AAF321_09450 [Pseudomonadota bacterium]